MKIVFFTRSKDSAISIGKAFAVLIDEISKSQQVKSYYVPYASYSPYKMWRNILYVYRNRTKTGINHITGEIHFCMFALIGVKSVLTVHDLGFYTNQPMSKIKKVYLYLFQLYFPFCLADKIVAISDFTRDEIIRLVPSVANKVMRANHHSVDEYIYTPKITINKDKPFILQIGTGSNKNLETTMRAVKGLNCHLRIIRKMTETQVQLAQELGIDYSNDWNLSNEQLVAEYQNCDIVCFPSIYEGLGAITIEAQAVGRAVISTNKEPMRSVAGGAAILLNNPKDAEELRSAILSLINNDSLRNDLVAKGLKNVENYKVASCAKQYINIYKKL